LESRTGSSRFLMCSSRKSGSSVNGYWLSARSDSINCLHNLKISAAILTQSISSYQILPSQISEQCPQADSLVPNRLPSTRLSCSLIHCSLASSLPRYCSALERCRTLRTSSLCLLC
jgi:hypothetical protein